jgi:tripartite-type tricarboxylate transporter receptor subunit TctC
MKRVSGARVAIALGLAMTAPARAQDAVADFYRGKTMTVMVGASAGGGVDLFGRMIARHIGKYIPGNPTVIVSNVPGAGSLVAAKNVYTVAPKDGLTMATVLPGAFFDPLFNPQPGDIRDAYDPTKFNFIANGNAEALVCIARTDSPIKRYEDVFDKEFVIGTPGPGSTVHVYSTVGKNLLGAKYKIVTGYPGTKQIMLGVQSGELQGVCGFSYSSAKLEFPGALEGKNGYKIIAQDGSVGTPELDAAHIPLTMSYAKDPEKRRALDVFYLQGMFSRAFMMAPGVPPARVEAVRKAFIDATKDKELLAEASQLQTEANASTGRELDDMVRRIYASPPDVIEMIRRAMN